MTPARRAAETANKRAERQRRKEAGEVRVECWLTPYHARQLDAYCARLGIDRQMGIRALIAKEAVR